MPNAHFSTLLPRPFAPPSFPPPFPPPPPGGPRAPPPPRPSALPCLGRLAPIFSNVLQVVHLPGHVCPPLGPAGLPPARCVFLLVRPRSRPGRARARAGDLRARRGPGAPPHPSPSLGPRVPAPLLPGLPPRLAPRRPRTRRGRRRGRRRLAPFVRARGFRTPTLGSPALGPGAKARHLRPPLLPQVLWAVRDPPRPAVLVRLVPLPRAPCPLDLALRAPFDASHQDVVRLLHLRAPTPAPPRTLAPFAQASAPSSRGTATR